MLLCRAEFAPLGYFRLRQKEASQSNSQILTILVEERCGASGRKGSASSV